MDNRILHIFAPPERLDLLSLGEQIYLHCGFKKGVEYSIQISVDMGVLETLDYYITGDNRIIKKENLPEMAHDYESLGIISFTLESYYEILAQRIEYSLPAIGLTYVGYAIEDASLVIKYETAVNDQEEYKKMLHDRIWKQFEFKTHEGLDTVKKRVLEFIRKQSSLLNTDALVIGKENIDIAFDVLPKPKPVTSPQDDIVLCDIYLSEDPLELILHDMVLDGFIETMEEYRGRFKVVINHDILEQEEPKKKPIEFNMDTGVIRINGIYVGKLKHESVLYEFFLILYKNQNTFVKTEDLAIKLKLSGHKRLPYEILRGYKNDLKSVEGLGDSFVKTYISTENKAFMLKNI